MIEREEETEKKYPNHYDRKRMLIPKRKTVEHEEIFTLQRSLLDHITGDKLLPLVPFLLCNLFQ